MRGTDLRQQMLVKTEEVEAIAKEGLVGRERR